MTAWIDRNSDRLFISVVTAAEVEAGIALAEQSGATRKAIALRDWWSRIETHYADRFLPLDIRIARLVGRLAGRAKAFSPQFQDLAIAATAEFHGLTVVTSNERHFRQIGVSYINPTMLTHRP